MRQWIRKLYYLSGKAIEAEALVAIKFQGISSDTNPLRACLSLRSRIASKDRPFTGLTLTTLFFQRASTRTSRVGADAAKLVVKNVQILAQQAYNLDAELLVIFQKVEK